MLDPYNIDFKKLGFHAGLEVHHQIKSKRKLFCNCPLILEENPENQDYSFFRYFRPVLGEMGDFDEGMLVEFEKGYKVIYLACERNTCTYEMDETPPFFPDMEAIEKGFILSAYFNCSAFAEEVVVNRKQYLDGSITTGFQRTFISGRDGWVPVNGKKVRITNVHIEEDAARRVNWTDTASRTVYFNLDRLGFPLTEIITEYTDVDTPEELLETAKQIGRVLRLSRIGRRGIGVARQDVNISIKGGDRVEIKGVQELDMFDVLARHEVVRQHSLLEIKEEMEKRKITEKDFQHTYIDISHVFNLEEGKKAYATIFPKMKGLFGKEVQPNKDFGLEIFEKSMLITGVPREDHFHSDELNTNSVRKRSRHPCRLDIDESKFSEICKFIKPKDEDVVVIVVASEKKALHALKKIVERVKIALHGVPQETRRLLPDGNTEFLRVIHGKDRIYPDTDTPPIVITLERIKEIVKNVGKKPWEIFEDLHDKYGFSHNYVDLLIRDEKVECFYDYTEKLNLSGSLAYHILIELPREMRRKGVHLSQEMLDIIARSISERIIIREQIPMIVNLLIENSRYTLEQIKQRVSSEIKKTQDIELIIKNKLSKYDKERLKSESNYQKRSLRRIVGEVELELNHSIPGREVLGRVKRIIKEVEN